LNIISYAPLWGKEQEILLMFIPLHGTGAITMTLAGRILALGEKATWLAVTLGSLARSLLIASLIYVGIIYI